MRYFSRAAASGLAAALALGAGPASACLSCGCGGSGTSADLGAVGGAASLFSQGQHWLIQEGTNFRNITGSFNERGEWNPVPTGGSLVSMQSALGITYFPSLGSSIGLQLPVVANRLDKAAWGPLGSVAPTDLNAVAGAALGDVAIQGSYRFYEADQWALAAWGGGSMPTGQVAGDPAGLTGSGVVSGQGGVFGVAQLGDVELSGTVGYQHPFGRPSLSASTFYVGEAWLYQLQGNYRLSDAWRVGLGLNGYQGNGRFGETELAVPMTKLKLVPSVQYSWATQGVRLAMGYDPQSLGANSMTDLSVYAVFYQYVQ